MIQYKTLKEAQAAGVAPWDLEVERLSDFHVAVFRDRFPVARGHLLFVPQYNTDAVIYDCFETGKVLKSTMHVHAIDKISTCAHCAIDWQTKIKTFIGNCI